MKPILIGLALLVIVASVLAIALWQTGHAADGDDGTPDASMQVNIRSFLMKHFQQGLLTCLSRMIQRSLGEGLDRTHLVLEMANSFQSRARTSIRTMPKRMNT